MSGDNFVQFQGLKRELEDAHIIVSRDDPLPVVFVDSTGTPLDTFRGGLDVHVADAHDKIVNDYFYHDTGTATTLSADVAAQDQAITVTSPTGFSVSDPLAVLATSTESSTHPVITNITGSVFDLDRPLDAAFLSGITVKKLSYNMAVNGAITPVSFKLSPHVGENWHVIRFLINMVHGSAGDDSKFGSLTELTNGVVMRIYNGSTGLFSTYTNW